MNELEYEIYKDKIVYIKNVIPNSKEIIEALESNKNDIITDWICWGNKYYTSLEQKKSDIENSYGSAKCLYSPLHDSEKKYSDLHWVYESIDSGLNKASDLYAKLMGIDTELNPRIIHSGFAVGRYDSNSARGPHIDCPYDEMEHSYVFYFNDDYKGGEIIFDKIKVTIKPEAGSVVMFKSCDPENSHFTHPNIGYKYIIPYFWRMGPSQGFVPYGTDMDSFIDFVSKEENITNDFENLKVVEEIKKKQA